MTGIGSKKMLQGLTVIEVGRLVAAPYCAKLVAELGVDVIKIEPPGIGDPARRRNPFPGDRPDPEQSGLFLYLNTCKRGITLDLETEGGRGLFHELLSEADVLIHDHAPADLERLGLDAEMLSKEFPRLVHTSITPFGCSGPYRDFRSHHLNIYHSSPHTTFSSTIGSAAKRAPAKAGRYLAEYDAGLSAAVGTLAAALEAGVTGRGQHIEVSKQEALLCIERVDIGGQINQPKPPPWRGSVAGLLRAKDGYVMVTPVQDHQWQGLVRCMGDPEWCRADWCQTEAGRQENRDEIRVHLEAWAAELTRDEIYHRLQAEGTPAGPVRNVAEVLEWEQAKARSAFVEIDHPEAGRHIYPAPPYRFSGEGWVGGPAPRLGEHNEEMYCGKLGYSLADLAFLTAAGVI